MPKEKSLKKSTQLHHSPLGSDTVKPAMKTSKASSNIISDAEDDMNVDAEDSMPELLGAKIFAQAREQRNEILQDKMTSVSATKPSNDV